MKPKPLEEVLTNERLVQTSRLKYRKLKPPMTAGSEIPALNQDLKAVRAEQDLMNQSIQTAFPVPSRKTFEHSAIGSSEMRTVGCNQTDLIEIDSRGRSYYDHRESIPFNSDFSHILADLPDQTSFPPDRKTSVSYGLRSTISKKKHPFKNLSLISKHSGLVQQLNFRFSKIKQLKEEINQGLRSLSIHNQATISTKPRVTRLRVFNNQISTRADTANTSFAHSPNYTPRLTQISALRGHRRSQLNRRNITKLPSMDQTEIHTTRAPKLSSSEVVRSRMSELAPLSERLHHRSPLKSRGFPTTLQSRQLTRRHSRCERRQVGTKRDEITPNRSVEENEEDFLLEDDPLAKQSGLVAQRKVTQVSQLKHQVKRESAPRQNQFVDLGAASCKITGNTPFTNNLMMGSRGVSQMQDIDNGTLKLLRENLLAPKYFKESPIRMRQTVKNYKNLRNFRGYERIN